MKFYKKFLTLTLSMLAMFMQLIPTVPIAAQENHQYEMGDYDILVQYDGEWVHPETINNFVYNDGETYPQYPKGWLSGVTEKMNEELLSSRSGVSTFATTVEMYHQVGYVQGNGYQTFINELSAGGNLGWCAERAKDPVSFASNYNDGEVVSNPGLSWAIWVGYNDAFGIMGTTDHNYKYGVVQAAVWHFEGTLDYNATVYVHGFGDVSAKYRQVVDQVNASRNFTFGLNKQNLTSTYDAATGTLMTDSFMVSDASLNRPASIGLPAGYYVTEATNNVAVSTLEKGKEYVIRTSNLAASENINLNVSAQLENPVGMLYRHNFMPEFQAIIGNVRIDPFVVETSLSAVFAPGFGTPSMKTTATTDTGAKVVDPQSKVVLFDKVAYEDILPGFEYTVTGKLYTPVFDSNGQIVGETPYLDLHGNEITSSASFTPTTENGEVEVRFEFDMPVTYNKQIVVFENLYYQDQLLATHADITDKGQTVDVPEPSMKTTAVNENQGKTVLPNKTAVIIDTIAYKNLIVGKEYTAVGKLYTPVLDNKGKIIGEKPYLDVNGKEITSSAAFTPTQKDGTVEVRFEFDMPATNKAEKIVVFEDVYYQDQLILTHADIEDEGQTVDTPKPGIKTTAYGNGETNKSVKANAEVVITDVVKYENLIPGRTYRLKGKLMNKATNKPLLIDGKIITAEKDFVPTKSHGSVEIDFVFNTTGLDLKDEIVVFEDVYYQNILVATHADIEDEGQTVIVEEPKIGTTATNPDGGKVVLADSDVIITDKVEYCGLTPGQEYKISGILMDKATNKPLETIAGQVKVVKTFVPETACGTVEVGFTLNTTNLKDKEIVVFEQVSRQVDGEFVIITTHEDITDEGQTIQVKEKLVVTGQTTDTLLGGLALSLSGVIAYLVSVLIKRKQNA